MISHSLSLSLLLLRERARQGENYFIFCSVCFLQLLGISRPFKRVGCVLILLCKDCLIIMSRINRKKYNSSFNLEGKTSIPELAAFFFKFIILLNIQSTLPKRLRYIKHPSVFIFLQQRWISDIFVHLRSVLNEIKTHYLGGNMGTFLIITCLQTKRIHVEKLKFLVLTLSPCSNALN